MRSNKNVSFNAAFFFLVLTLCLCYTVSAQTPRRTPKPLATPPPVLTGAEIISRADDHPVETQSGGDPAAAPVADPVDAERSSVALRDRVTKGKKLSYDEKQKRLMMNLDILTRAEQRTEGLRKQLFEMIEKESAVKTRLDQIEYDSRPEMIERSSQLAGSLRPEVIRESRRKSLEAERANLETLLNEIQMNRSNLTANLLRADTMVEKLRAKLEKEIDDALIEEEEPVE
jgi:hypothetical protein